MKDVDPWLNSEPRLDNRRAFNEQILLKPEIHRSSETFVIVPTELVEHAKRILAPHEHGMQLPIERQLSQCPLYMFSRVLSRSTLRPYQMLVQQRIPCVIASISTQDNGRRGERGARMECDIYSWSEDSDYLVHQTMVSDPRENVDDAIENVDRYLAQLDWKGITRYAYVIKTKELLKGNSDGLPKSYEQSQNWAFK